MSLSSHVRDVGTGAVFAAVMNMTFLFLQNYSVQMTRIEIDFAK